MRSVESDAIEPNEFRVLDEHVRGDALGTIDGGHAPHRVRPMRFFAKGDSSKGAPAQFSCRPLRGRT